MIEVKKTYQVKYNKGGYEHTTVILAQSYGETEAKFLSTFKDCYITGISFAGSVCV